MNQSGIGQRSGSKRWGIVVATAAAIVGLAACQPVVPGAGDGGAPTATLVGSTWVDAFNPDVPTAGSSFDVGSTVLPTTGAVEDLVLVQSFPAGVTVHGATGTLEAWDPASGDLVQRDAECTVAGRAALCTIDGTIDSNWAIDRLEIRTSVTAPAGDVVVTLDASASDPTGADPTPIHRTTTITVAP